MIKINDEELDKFLISFDAISFKYGIKNESYVYLDAYEYEKKSEPIDYSKKDTASFVENMCMVYGCDELEANRYLWRCKTVVGKILNQYIHIEGLSRLFNEHYIEFEWDMHSRMDFNEHKISYYRDHFFHQLRDCFMLYKLLEDKDIYKKTKETFLSSSSSKVSRYFTENIDKLTFNIYDQQQLYHILNKIGIEKILCHSKVEEIVVDFCKKNACINNCEEKIIKALKCAVIQQYNLTQAKVYNDSFYDILIIKKEIAKCVASVWMAEVGNIDLSLGDVIKFLYDNNDDFVCKYKGYDLHELEEKRECIEQLSCQINEYLKQSIVNLAGNNFIVKDYFSKYIIFSSAFISSLFHDIGYPITHFLGFQKRLLGFSPSIYMIINGDKSSYEKIIAKLSQSLLFQVVSNDEIVQRCGKHDHGVFSAIILLLHFYESGLIFSLPIEQKVAIELAALAIYNHTNRYEHVLGKEKHTSCHYYRPIFKLNPISFLLRLCDDAQEWQRTYFEICDTPSLLYCEKCYTPLIRKKSGSDYKYKCRCGESSGLKCACFKSKNTDFRKRVIYNVIPSNVLKIEDSSTALKFKFIYDFFWLLRMCSISTTYAPLRTSELNYINQFVFGQNIGKKIEVEFTLSCNPIYLKSLIIGQYFQIIDDDKKNTDIEAVILKLIEDNCTGSTEEMKNKWKAQLMFYLNIYNNGKQGVKNNAETLCTGISDQSGIVKKLVASALEQYCGNNPSKSLSYDVNFYCDCENEINHKESNVFFPDYYSDLYLFECIMEKIKKHEETSAIGSIKSQTKTAGKPSSVQ